MNPSESTEKEILKKVLTPLLEDFDYWFSRSSSLLESQKMGFLSVDEQENLLQRIKNAQEEVKTSIMLFKITDSQVGVETKILFSWHQLVSECWQIARKWRLEKTQLTTES
ncbi:MAG: DUF2605 domain-containing protein [Cyanobacteria bacterium]|nr:DUF2605 domain-containing protein [Cyanobacteria bacterium CG_2015-16_32_12]NCO78884.1 DUF2605 domain-containing protein [Cyanobacteria bacterium CG_2015-22_32_23]NCQ04511.1 DUF2605 domain-containing protein [Cyanobacteria bacterium CG_2015-09_32_10]NCQ40683.1 DUF2605 domain-containing protein [Cyanobacteria bacterium CG_2015-04_32_10]NCS85806.1 DUF2605 domain-containing protein [Cyanobacteria bacterium CG_2015-02_32_10]